ncbi:glycosyltransferase family 2 protein [Lysobacter sp. A286]
MACVPWFVIGPSTWLAVSGYWRAADPTVPAPAEDWRRAIVDVVIPVCRNQDTIAHCLASLLRQTRLPRRVVLVDDAGVDRDHTIQFAREFARANGIDLQIVVRAWSIGRAATLKWQARQFTGDVMCVLDADTVLESPDYIERCVRELYQGVGIASACGSVRPLRHDDRAALATTTPFRCWLGEDGYRDPCAHWPVYRRWWHALGVAYHEHLAQIQQEVIDRGLMRSQGGIACATGGAVVYRRRYLEDLFDRYEPIRGDDLTAVEDQFIALALVTEGYRNIRIADVVARTQYPELQHLPRRCWQASIGLLQCGHYFDVLLRSPLRVAQRWMQRRGKSPSSVSSQDPGTELRRVREAYRQPFGERLTGQLGRPAGTTLVLMALEQLGYPTLLYALMLTGHWSLLASVVGLEVGATLLLAWRFSGPHRWLAVGRAAFVAPLRYALVLTAPWAMAWFAARLWMWGRYRWFVRRQVDGVRLRRGR